MLIAPDAPLDRTLPATHAMTVRHLLTCTAGMGCVLEPTPLQAAMLERGVFPGPLPAPMTGDEFVARVAQLPLAFEPGEGWLYDTPINLLGVLLERATQAPLSSLIAERITGPLGYSATAFHAAHGLATAYMPSGDGLELLDPPDGVYASPPAIEELTGGLISTAADVLCFYGAMADGGAPVLTPSSLALMTADALTDAQREQALPFVDAGGSWGLATAVYDDGRWGWDGGTGTTARVDPHRGTVAVLLTQRAMTSALDGFDRFHAAVAAAARLARMQAIVPAVSRAPEHELRKPTVDRIRLLNGRGVEGEHTWARRCSTARASRTIRHSRTSARSTSSTMSYTRSCVRGTSTWRPA